MFTLQTHTPSTVIFDLADRHTVEGAAEEILKCYGHVDVLINNAGISFRGNILDTSVSVQRDVMETNYFGPVALTQGQLVSAQQKKAKMLCLSTHRFLSSSNHSSPALHGSTAQRPHRCHQQRPGQDRHSLQISM